MILKCLLLQKHLIAELTLILLLDIVLVQMHTKSAGFGRRVITFGTHIESGVILFVASFARHYNG
jgi:hypothetical protein